MKKYISLFFVILFLITGCGSDEVAQSNPSDPGSDEVAQSDPSDPGSDEVAQSDPSDPGSDEVAQSDPSDIDPNENCLDEECAMLSQGPKSATVAVDETSVGSLGFGVTLASIFSENSVPATAPLVSVGDNTHYAKITGYGFALPLNAVVQGIAVEVRKAKQTGDITRVVRDYRVRIVKNGSIGSTDRSNVVDWPNGGAFAYTTYGSSTDLWGETWTAADINNSTFGFAIAATLIGPTAVEGAQIDNTRITVYYDLPADLGMNL